MAVLYEVVLTLLAGRIATHPTESSQPIESFATPGEELVNVRLMADVPEDTINRRIENAMKRDGEFHDAQVRRQVAPGSRDPVDEETAYLLGQIIELRGGEILEVSRLVDAIEQRHQADNATRAPPVP